MSTHTLALSPSPLDLTAPEKMSELRLSKLTRDHGARNMSLDRRSIYARNEFRIELCVVASNKTRNIPRQTDSKREERLEAAVSTSNNNNNRM
mmetsp:Transcript_17589/g.38174  ORF Transcript_17589/g.38174 Transcript_17589/m.38174 type:complete len:93 (-) Transcript_17589:158-436(-)